MKIDTPHKHLYGEWVFATAIGELAGFTIPTVIGVSTAWYTANFSPDTAQLIMFLAMIIAGIGEGAVFAFAQWYVLKKYIKGLEEKNWILFTALAAALGWAIGMLPTTFGESLASLHPALSITGIIFLAPLLLLSIGFAQWLVLRRHVKHAGWWIFANSIAWPIGVLVSILILYLVPDDSPTVRWVIAGVMAGITMGATVGAITGIALIELVPKIASDRPV